MTKKKPKQAKTPDLSDENATEKEQQSFWAKPAGIATLVTAILTGIAAVITALHPLISPIPTQTPLPSPIPAEGISPSAIDFCDDYFNPDHLPVYNLSVGIPRSLDLTKPITNPIALKFVDVSMIIGGMKIEYKPGSDSFVILSNVGENCLEISFEGKDQLIQNRVENQLQYGERLYHFTLTYDHDQQNLQVDLRAK